jgi:hypothetical protein
MFIKNILPIAIFLIALGSAYMYVYPKYQETVSLKAQAAQFDTALDTANKVQDLSSTISDTINAISPQDHATLDTILPDDVNRLELGNDLVALAAVQHITLTNITIGSDSTGAVATTPPQVGASARSSDLQKMNVTLSFSASYQTFKAFLANLEQSLQLFTVDSFTVTPADREPYTYQVQLSTYSLPNNNPQ